MRVSILSDEISPDYTAACELAAEWGLKHFELRSWCHGRAPENMSDSAMQHIRQTADSFGIDFPSISPGLFKVSIDDEAALMRHRGDFQKRSYDLAEVLGARIVVLFPPIRRKGEGYDDWSPQVVADFRNAAEAAQARGLTLAIENEPICYGGTGQSVARFAAVINHPAAKVNWDPGNQLNAVPPPEDFRAGYAAVKPYQAHCHVKDYLVTRNAEGAINSQCVPPGEGQCDWLGQLQALKDDNYQGLLVLETHFTPKIAGSRNCFRALCRLMETVGIPVQ